ncbi:hypothetical protein C8Q79DRAFT_1001259 [Trametes meyenii]|nr:hypothetical protein C8Q79DRAFT_1001259 [Trametes meyenii]
MSFAPGPSRIPAPRSLHGSKPGLLDHSQPERLLRAQGSTLSFAVFDPLCASASAGHRRSRYDPDPARPKRIVIEIPPGGRGQCRWRFVPRARRAPGVEDEGVWPRRVSLCGEPIILSEEQWDIYKLDPVYDCFVPAFPSDPVITRRESPPQTHYNPSRDGSRKHRPSSPPHEEEEPLGIHKKFRRAVNLDVDEEDTDLESATESDDESEVEEIVAEEVIAGSGTLNSGRPGRPKECRKETRRREERKKLKANGTSSSFESHRPTTPEIVDLTMEDVSPPGEPETNNAPKRKYEDSANRPNKKIREHSPVFVSRTERYKRQALRQRQRHIQSQQRANGLKEERERRFMEEILAESARNTPHSSQSSSSMSLSQPMSCADGDAFRDTQAEPEIPDAGSQSADEEAQRQAEIEESRRKLAELERDRPLWEQQAQKRSAQERAEEEALRARKRDEQRRAAAAAAEEQYRRQRAEAEAAEAERRARWERERVEREREQRRQRERERWSYGPWTPVRAIERYKMLSEAFDTTKFTPEDPVLFETVPWPVLHSPVTLRVEDIEWAAVEEFFDAAKRHMRSQHYKVFVEKSHKRFHPDRWRARGVLKSVADEEQRGCLEVAANTVAQALTPIWRDVRG